MSSSRSLSILAKSVLIARSFAGIGLPYRNNSCCVASLRVGDDHHASSKRADCQVSGLAVRLLQIFERQYRSGEHEVSVCEIQAVLLSVRPVLRTVPLERHRIYKL